MRFPSAGFVLMALALAACQPTPMFNHGDRSAFISPQGASPSDKPPALVERAVRLEVDADEAVITEAGGTYLGELVVTSQSTNAPSLYGIASLDAASHGGTHFYVKTFKTQGGRRKSGVATYAIYRVEPGAWPALPPKYLPVAPLPSGPAAP